MNEIPPLNSSSQPLESSFAKRLQAAIHHANRNPNDQKAQNHLRGMLEKAFTLGKGNKPKPGLLRRRYAKADTRHVAHPLVEGFPIEIALRHLANDTKAHSDIRNLAKVALTGGDKGDATPMALWLLHDALHENGHPAKDWYNWMSARDKVYLDRLTYQVLQEEGTRSQYYEGANAQHGDQQRFSPEYHATEAMLGLDKNRGGNPNYPPFVRRDALVHRIKARMKSLAPDIHEKDVEESINRHAWRSHIRWRKANGITEDDPRDLGPYVERKLPAGVKRPHIHNMEKATRYALNARSRPRRYAMAPNVNDFGPRLRESINELREKGIFSFDTYNQILGHDILADYLADHADPRERIVRNRTDMETAKEKHGVAHWRGKHPDAQRMAFKDGTALQWFTASDYGREGKEPVHYVQWGGDTEASGKDQDETIPWYGTAMTDSELQDFMGSFEPHEAPQPWKSNYSRAKKYALNARGDFLDSLRRVKSKQQAALHQTARTVAGKLGLVPSDTVDALHDAPHGSTPGIAQAIYNGSPEVIHMQAAWLGLTGNLPGVAVFHPRQEGPDVLHKFFQAGSGLDIRHKLTRHGLTNRVLMLKREGFDVIIPDSGGKLSRIVQDYSKVHGATLQTSRGYFHVIGDQDRSKAREKFRSTVVKGEK